MGKRIAVKRGEIWLVNLDPTIGHEIRKSRPGIIIQNDIGNKYSPITIIAPVTSSIEKIYPIEVLLTKKNSGLKKESKAVLNQIRAIDKKRLIRKIGRLKNSAIGEVNEAIKISLGLY
ncbi:type II toxin-antitoxin system PemK/MazF family toxin [Candidatus Woesearchaeota archaeon]|nr:type II toxin-antitoxin system PemK/MazF family toxin [Candidatus Woesearchaeota archaeon]